MLTRFRAAFLRFEPDSVDVPFPPVAPLHDMVRMDAPAIGQRNAIFISYPANLPDMIPRLLELLRDKDVKASITAVKMEANNYAAARLQVLSKDIKMLEGMDALLNDWQGWCAFPEEGLYGGEGISVLHRRPISDEHISGLQPSSPSAPSSPQAPTHSSSSPVRTSYRTLLRNASNVLTTTG